MAGTVQAFQANPVATIPASDTKTGAIGFGSFAQGIFILPATFTGVAMTFEVSANGIDFFPFNNDSGAVSLTVAQGKAYAFPIGLFAAPWIKLVSGSTEDTARTIQLLLKY